MNPDVLVIDAGAVSDQICGVLRDQVLRQLRRRGVVVGLSGGVDSSVAAALCVRALGPDRVLGLLMPEKDSDPESLRLGRLVADGLAIEAILEDIAPVLEAAGCYRRRDAFVRQVFPDYGPGWKCKLVLPNVLEGSGYNLSWLVVETPDGVQRKARPPYEAYLGIVAASNMKQRARKQCEYYHADRLNHAVVGTPNRLEYDQGFFVKNGDGAADVKPIAHLYKSQVYQLALHLGIDAEIRQRTPTTDTYPMQQTQQEFYFALPYQQLDFCLFALNRGISDSEVADAIGLAPEAVQRVYRDIQSKRRATAYLHQPPLLIEPVSEAGN